MIPRRERRHPIVVAGAGPAGLSAALTLARAGHEVLVLDPLDGVGGIARTVERQGYRFDLGGHRFFTELPEIRALWDELVGPDMLLRRRRSRVLLGGRTLDYPLTLGSTLRALGPLEGLRVLASAGWARLAPVRPEEHVAAWLTNRFGRRLFETFFRPYTEKVWGMPCESLGADWVAQRIQGLSLRTAIADLLRRGSTGRRTLATEFQYPRLGPGMLWERMRAEIERAGGRIALGHRLAEVRHAGGVVTEVGIEGPGGLRETKVAALVSTVPLRDLGDMLAPRPDPETLSAFRALRYRDFLQVALVLDGPDPFPDTWLYLHDPAIRAGRAQNFRAWSPDLVPDPSTSCVGLEYFCQRGDPLWSASDDALVELAAEDLRALGLGTATRVLRGHVVRVAAAYPVYDRESAARLRSLRRHLDGLRNLAVAGRAGMHRYDNMDLAMWTGALAARRLLGGTDDPWEAQVHGLLEPVTRSTTSAGRSGRTGGRATPG